MVKDNVFTCKTKLESMYSNDTFALRLYRLSSWLNKRYKIKSKSVDFDYSFEEEDKDNDLVTIKLTFN